MAAWWSRGKGFARQTFEALALWLRRPRGLVYSLGFTFLHMACTFLSAWVVLDALGEPVRLPLIAGLWGVAYFVTLVPISINGYGLQELSLTWLFTNVAGVPLTDSLVFALLMRLLTVVASLPGAFYLPSVMASMDRREA